LETSCDWDYVVLPRLWIPIWLKDVVDELTMNEPASPSMPATLLFVAQKKRRQQS